MELEKLLSEVRLIVEKDKQQREEAYRRGELYNVFNVLGVYNQELMHSAFLATLLNPNADHGMKDAFLKAFLACNNVSLQIDTTHAKVETEHTIGTVTDTEGGRIDILVTDADNSRAIIIENKIWAGDKPRQMTRYHTFGRQTYKDGFALLYLTLDGHEPSEDSIGELDSKKNDYRCISYRDHIIPWLQQCAQLAFDKSRVREVIVQYINVLQQLTNQNTMEENKDALTKLLSAEANFPQAWEIAENLFATKQYLVENVLREQLENLGYNITECTYGRGNYGGITITIPDWKHCSVTFEFERLSGTTDLCYGITGQSEEDYTNIFNKNRYGTTNTWTAWKWMEKYRYWTNIDTFMDIYSGEVAKEMGKCIEELLEIVTTNHMEL